jgi:thiol-disulfide isomerase/thioredoxin
MKITSSTFLAILILMSSCTSHSDSNIKNFTLSGSIEGQDSGIIILRYISNAAFKYDTSKIINGNFIFKGKIDGEPKRALIKGGDNLNTVQIYIEPQNMKVLLIKDKYEEYKMTGSKTQNDFEVLTKLKEPFYERISILKHQMAEINDSIQNSKSDPTKILLKAKVEEIQKLMSQTYKRIDSIQIRFILKNPKSFIAVERLWVLGSNEVISLDSTKSIFDRLDNSLKNSKYGQFIIEEIRKKENIRIGKQAPDFKSTGLNSQTVSLSQFNGKSYILLDFWASWCVPCRESTPHLKTIYNKYHSKGFEVIAVSIDDDKKAWLEAVKQDSTSMWYHIQVAEKWPCGPEQLTNYDIAQNYSYNGVPNMLLIDKNGKILCRYTSASIENQESLDRLLAQIFGN